MLRCGITVIASSNESLKSQVICTHFTQRNVCDDIWISKQLFLGLIWSSHSIVQLAENIVFPMKLWKWNFADHYKLVKKDRFPSLIIYWKQFADIDECASEPCMNAALCADSVNEWDCTCLDGFTGTQCETGMWNIYILLKPLKAHGSSCQLWKFF